MISRLFLLYSLFIFEKTLRTLFSSAFSWDETRDLMSKTILVSIMAASMCCCLANIFPE